MIELNTQTQQQADEATQQLMAAARVYHDPDSAYPYTAGYFRSLTAHLIGLLPDDEAQRQIQMLKDSAVQLEQSAIMRGLSK